MQINGPFQIHGAQGPRGPYANRPQNTRPNSNVNGTGDQVEISAAGEAAAQAVEGGEARTELVARIRSEIAAGTYETADKLDAALNGLLDDLA